MLNIGIVGLPNVGKSTLFKALTKQKVEIANYPFATIDPNVGVVEIPDERLERLAAISSSKKIIPAIVEFVDIAGLVKGASEGEGLGNKFLTHIKAVDAIAEVTRVFENKDIIRVADSASPESDMDVLEYELIMKDLESVIKRLDTARRDARGNRKGAEKEVSLLEALEKDLKKGMKAKDVMRGQKIDETEERVLKELSLLTAKPFIYVFNVSEKQLQEAWKPEGALKEKIGKAPFVTISAKIEAELADLPEQEQNEYLEALGLRESGLAQLIRTGYQTLDLMTFFTTGEDESRAWTIPVGSSAPRAGRAIHSDFEEKFIRAEVINWQKLLEAGSWTHAREKGLLRIEGKEYIVQDGDVVEFKI